MATVKLRHTATEIDDILDQALEKQDRVEVQMTPGGSYVITGLGERPITLMPGTPSGDPMHYMYEAAGAVYNDGVGSSATTPWGETATHLPECWYLNGLGDITTAQMRQIYMAGFLSPATPSPLSTLSVMPIHGMRTNLSRIGDYSQATFNGVAKGNNKIEVVNLTSFSRPSSISLGGVTIVGKDSFKGCSALIAIIGTLTLVGDISEMFSGCTELREVRISGLDKSIDLSAAAALSKDSLFNILNTSAATSPIDIKLHSRCYSAFINDPDIVSALSRNTNITLKQ